MSLRFTILGCGSSPGTPRIGGPDGKGDWGDCDPDNPKNRRTRCSLLVEKTGPNGVTRIVVDTSPDFRAQMLAAGVTGLDGAVYTHPHADHIHGVDDLRQFAILHRRRIDTYADEQTFERLYQGFGYCYETPEGSIYPPILNHHPIRAGEIFAVPGAGGPIKMLPVLQEHGPIASLGFRFGGSLEEREGGLCYSPDISGVPDGSIADLSALDVWIIDALQYREHISHFSLGQALDWIGRLDAKKAILTHMHIPLDYVCVKNETPAHVEPAFDGMVIELD